MDKLDLIYDDTKEAKESILRVEARVNDVFTRLAVVEERTTRKAAILSAIISAITSFFAGLLGR